MTTTPDQPDIEKLRRRARYATLVTLTPIDVTEETGYWTNGTRQDGYYNVTTTDITTPPLTYKEAFFYIEGIKTGARALARAGGGTRAREGE